MGAEPTFAERLTSWLKFVEMRPATLARALNVSKTAIHNWMTGAVAPGTDRIGPITKALGISTVEFFARMPTLEAKEPLEEEELDPHPFTGEVTRVMALQEHEASLNRHACESCRGTGVKQSIEAA